MLLTSIFTGCDEAGCDEAGRGCLAGPVFAAAVILPEGYRHPDLNDSKKIPENKREKLRQIIEYDSVSWSVASVTPAEIDQLNILNASLKAMHLALDGLAKRPAFIAVDGNRFIPYHNVPYQTVVKGDGKYQHIAAASILAKTHRDLYMRRIHEEFPVYDWLQNKGYPTVAHRQAVQKYGLSPYHRRSFKVTSPQLSMF